MKKRADKAVPSAQQQAQQEDTKPEVKPEPELHQASRRGDAEQVTALLHKGHDPTVSVGKTLRLYLQTSALHREGEKSTLSQKLSSR